MQYVNNWKNAGPTVNLNCQSCPQTLVATKNGTNSRCSKESETAENLYRQPFEEGNIT